MNEQRVTDMLLKLNRYTASGKIQWSAHNSVPLSLEAGDEKTTLTYRAKVGGRWMQLYKFKQRISLPYDEGYDMQDAYRLELITEHGQTEKDIPLDATVRDLYDTVTDQASNFDKFMDGFLNE